jgi:hypothetical protein
MARTAQMKQADFTHQKPPVFTEYSIYVFHHPDNQKEDQNDWEKTTTTTSLEKALSDARALEAAGDYSRVEVKKKYFDQRYNCNLEMTLQSFGDKVPRLSFFVVLRYLFGRLLKA